MKGLEEYIEVHGRHFTEELGYAVSGGRYDADKVGRMAQRKVYYNVTGSTLGDMVYLANTYWHQPYPDCKRLNKCIDFALCIVGSYYFHGGKVFDMWLESLPDYMDDFDFTPYI